jgi:Domain of unknown function (DUF1996)
MNDPIVAPGAARPKAAQALEHVFSGMRTNGPQRLWGISGVLLLVLLLAVLLGPLAARADAEPRLKTGCTIYATNRVDPIAFAQHLHHQFGNTSTTNQSTGTSLFNNRSTSCRDSWFTSAGWFPVERYEPVSRVAVYYRAPGDQRQIRSIPTGLQLLATDQMYSCGSTAEGVFQVTPPYRCTQDFNTRVIFPDCWNRRSLEETTMVMSNNGVCPSTHPYRIPQISFLIQHDNVDGRVANPLVVSGGVNTWEPYTAMHGDYFAANQSVFNNVLLDLCLRNAPDSVTIADPRCGLGP